MPPHPPHGPGAARLPEIIAHRGASRDCFENTMAAFSLALEQGADGLELDVHGTNDGVVVVHHDPCVERRSAGRAESVPIAALSAAELSACRLPSGDPIPTLAEVLAMVGDQATVYVEVKGAGIESPVVAVLEAHAQVRTAVHAFDHRIPVAVRRRLPGLPIGLLSASYPLDVRAVLADSGARDFWQHADLIDESLVRAVHALGARLIAWTENDAPHARRLTAWGVDALCTDVPGLLRTALSAGADPASPSGVSTAEAP